MNHEKLFNKGKTIDMEMAIIIVLPQCSCSPQTTTVQTKLNLITVGTLVSN